MVQCSTVQCSTVQRFKGSKGALRRLALGRLGLYYHPNKKRGIPQIQEPLLDAEAPGSATGGAALKGKGNGHGIVAAAHVTPITAEGGLPLPGGSSMREASAKEEGVVLEAVVAVGLPDVEAEHAVQPPVAGEGFAGGEVEEVPRRVGKPGGAEHAGRREAVTNAQQRIGRRLGVAEYLHIGMEEHIAGGPAAIVRKMKHLALGFHRMAHDEVFHGDPLQLHGHLPGGGQHVTGEDGVEGLVALGGMAEGIEGQKSLLFQQAVGQRRDRKGVGAQVAGLGDDVGTPMAFAVPPHIVGPPVVALGAQRRSASDQPKRQDGGPQGASPTLCETHTPGNWSDRYGTNSGT